MIAQPEVDLTDPLVVVLTWGLTEIAARWIKGRGKAESLARLRHVIPTISLLIAVGIRAALAQIQGQAVDFDLMCRALAAAGVAVLTHSQVREGQKYRESNPEEG